MTKLKDETHVLMDGAVKVYRRPNTRLLIFIQNCAV